MTGLILGATIATAWAFIGTIVFRHYEPHDYHSALSAWGLPAVAVPLGLILVNPTAAPLWAISCSLVAVVFSTISLYALSRLPQRFDAGHTFRP